MKKILLPQMEIDGDDLGYTLALALRAAYEAHDGTESAVENVVMQLAEHLSPIGLDAILYELKAYNTWANRLQGTGVVQVNPFCSGAYITDKAQCVCYRGCCPYNQKISGENTNGNKKQNFRP